MIDWRELVFSLERKTGLSDAQIASRIGVPPSTLNSWKNGNVREPKFSHGLAAVELYVEHCGRQIPYA